jgi:hypothetical protein
VDVFDELLPLDALPRLSDDGLDFGTGEAEPAAIPPPDTILRILRPRWLALAHVTKPTAITS